MINIKSCVFDCYETSALLERLAICALGVSRSHALVDPECVWVQRLNTSACLVAEVEGAFVLPLWGAFDTAVEAERLSVLRDYLKTTKTTIGHGVKRVLLYLSPIRLSHRMAHHRRNLTLRGDPLKWDSRRMVLLSDS